MANSDDLIARARDVVARAKDELSPATYEALITELADALEKAQEVVHAVERVIGADTDISPGDGVWVDLSSWEAVEDLVGGREVMYERYRNMLNAEVALKEARRCRMCDGAGKHEDVASDFDGPHFVDCTACRGTGSDR